MLRPIGRAFHSVSSIGFIHSGTDYYNVRIGKGVGGVVCRGGRGDDPQANAQVFHNVMHRLIGRDRMWLSIFAASCAVICVLSLGGCVLAVRNAVRHLESQPPQPCSCESKTRSLAASVEELQLAITDVANRVKMMRVRSAVNHVRDPDELPSDPASLKNVLRKRAGLMAGKPAPHR